MGRTQRGLLLAALLLAAPTLAAQFEGKQTNPKALRPHIVLILADDLGWGDVGYHDAQDVRTPHIDALASAGIELDHFYVQSTCTPTRSALMTGRYPSRFGLQACALMPWAKAGLALDERLLPELLHEAGYRTAIVGKWHLGHFREEYLPMQRGFDSQYGLYADGIDYFTHDRGETLDWHRDQVALREPGYVTDLLAAEAVRIIAEQPLDEPLFLYLPFTAPHAPIQAPSDTEASFAAIKNKARRTFVASVSKLDEGVGRVVQALKDRGISEQTLLLFISDNGASWKHAGSNKPLRGSKFTAYEGGLRVPAIACWPGKLKAGTSTSEVLHIVDLLPTLSKLAGASTQETKPLDGLNMWPVLTRGRHRRNRALTLQLDQFGGAIRVGAWKLIVYDKAHQRGPTLDGSVELYDVLNDPSETTNLAKAQPERVKTLFADLRQAARAAVPTLKVARHAPPGYQPPKVLEPFVK